MAMLLRRAFAVAVVGAVPCAASAQTWQEAVKKGDYQTAAALLQPLAVQSLLDVNWKDPEPARQLAVMYRQGLGVSKDPVLACGLARKFSSIVTLQPGQMETIDDFNASQARLRAAETFARIYCTSLSAADSESADRIACLTFGMPDEVLTVGTEALRVDRAGIRLASDDSRRSEIPTNCPQLIARVLARSMEPPADAVSDVKPRHFVEVLAWQAGQSLDDEKVFRYFLSWQLFELREKKLELVALENVQTSDRWPSPVLPQDFDSRLTLEMIRTGHVHWKIDGAPPQRGWVMLPEKEQ